MPTSEAQRRAVKKYQDKMKHISLEMDKVVYKKIKMAAAYVGESVNSFIVSRSFDEADLLVCHLNSDAHEAGMSAEDYLDQLKEKRAQEKKQQKTVMLNGEEIPVIENKRIPAGGQSGRLKTGPSIIETIKDKLS